MPRLVAEQTSMEAGLALRSGDFGLMPANDTWAVNFTATYTGDF